MALIEAGEHLRSSASLDGAVHLWTIDFSGAVSPDGKIADASLLKTLCDSFYEVLAPGERERANRNYFEKDRFAAVLTRGALRLLLSNYFGAPPDEWTFVASLAGKPALSPKRHGSLAGSVHFNVSHTTGMSAIGITRSGSLGVDVEYRKRTLKHELIAQRFFSPKEIAALTLLPEEQRCDGFFNAWTRKEAYLKGCGDGLGFPLRDFDVTLVPGDEPRLLEIRDAGTVSGAPGCASEWTLFSAASHPSYAVAAAVRARDICFLHFERDLANFTDSKS